MNNVREGRIIKSSNEWDLKCDYIDVPENIDDIFIDLYSDQFEKYNAHKEGIEPKYYPNAYIRISPWSVDPDLQYDKHSEDGFTEYEGMYPESPKVDVRERDMIYIDDTGDKISEDEFLNLTGVSKERLPQLKKESLDYAKRYLEQWIKDNYNDHFEN